MNECYFAFIHMNNSVHSQVTAQLSITCCILLQVHNRKLGVGLKVRPKNTSMWAKNKLQTKEQIVNFHRYRTFLKPYSDMRNPSCVAFSVVTCLLPCLVCRFFCVAVAVSESVLSLN